MMVMKMRVMILPHYWGYFMIRKSDQSYFTMKQNYYGSDCKLATELGLKKAEAYFNDVPHSKCVIDQLHAIGNTGNAFACLSGRSRKLVSLAHRHKENFSVSLIMSHPSLIGYQSLNSQKYSELNILHLMTIEDIMKYLSIGDAKQASAKLAISGGRSGYIHEPLEQSLKCTSSTRNGIEWLIYRDFIKMNLNIMESSYERTRKSWDALLNIGHLGRVRIQELIDKIEPCDFEVDDLVDRDVLIPVLGDGHSFKPAYCRYLSCL